MREGYRPKARGLAIERQTTTISRSLNSTKGLGPTYASNSRGI